MKAEGLFRTTLRNVLLLLRSVFVEFAAFSNFFRSNLLPKCVTPPSRGPKNSQNICSAQTEALFKIAKFYVDD